MGAALSGESDRRRPHSGARKEHREEDPARRSPPHPQQEINGIKTLLMNIVKVTFKKRYFYFIMNIEVVVYVKDNYAY